MFHAKPTHALISARIVITTLNYHIKLPQMLKHHGHISVCLLALWCLNNTLWVHLLYFPQCILLENTIWSYSTTHFDWSLISGQLCTGYCLIKTQAREWRWYQWGCRLCRFGWRREFDGGYEHLGAPNFDTMLLDWAAHPRWLLQSAFRFVPQSWWWYSMRKPGGI